MFQRGKDEQKSVYYYFKGTKMGIGVKKSWIRKNVP